MKKIISCLLAGVMLLTFTAAAVPVQSFSGVYVDEDMKAFHQNLAEVCSGGKWGYVGIDGQIVIDFQYSAAFPFSEDKAFVMKEDGKYCCIDKTGAELFTLECTAVYPYSEGVARFVKDGLTGFVDTAGNVVGEVKWDAARDAHEGFIAVREGELWGYIKTDGSVSVSCKYNTAEDYSGGLAYVTLNDDGYLMDAEGNPYLYGAKSGCVDNLIKMKSGELYGFMDKTGKAVIEPIYQDVGMPANSRIPVLVDGLWGYMDYAGNMIVQPAWTNAYPFVDGVARVWLAESGYTYINTMGERITENNYGDARDLSNGRAAVSIEGLWGFIDRLGTVTSECSYDYAGNYSEGGTVVKTNGAYYVLNDKGQKITFGVEPEKTEESTEEQKTETTETKPEKTVKTRQIAAFVITVLLIVYDASLAALRFANIRKRRRRRYE